MSEQIYMMVYFISNLSRAEQGDDYENRRSACSVDWKACYHVRLNVYAPECNRAQQPDSQIIGMVGFIIKILTNWQPFGGNSVVFASQMT